MLIIHMCSFLRCCSVTKKHIDQATENLNNRPKDSTGEFNSLLEEMIMKGMSYKDTATLVMDTMLGGIDTVTEN